MTQDEYLKFHREMCDEARALSARKNNDYAAPAEHAGDPLAPFRNFTACERIGLCTTEQGFMVRKLDKFMRLCNLLKPGHKQGVMDESIKDTLQDDLNYSCLLAAYLKAKGEQQ